LQTWLHCLALCSHIVSLQISEVQNHTAV
jgi:hypothetical protein